MRTLNYAFKSLLASCISVFLLTASNPVSAELTNKERNILANKAKTIDLAKVLITDNSWNKLPDYKNRQFWQNLPANIRQEYIAKAEPYLVYNWPVVKATDYLEFIRSGDRNQQACSACSNALITLVMGELVEGKGRFIDQIINAVWYYSEQTWWGWSAHLYFQKSGNGLPDVNDPTVDLGVGEITNNLTWTWYLFKDEFDKVHPLISTRLKQEITNKALKPYFERDDFGYMGFKGGRPNNWNPWINYNMLNCFLLLENDPSKKVAEVQKIINSLDKFLNGYSDDGGYDEGPSYWGAAGALLYESLEIMKNATNNKFDVFEDPLVQDIGKYFYKVNIHAPYFLNFADADATTGGSPSSVYSYGKAIKDVQMQQFGSYLAKLGKWGEHSFGGKICDQIRDLGREEYTAKTFSSKRYEIWTMQSGYHNLPVINGVEQKDGSKFKAKNSTFTANPIAATFSTEISGAYPKEAQVKSWIRSYILNRGISFVISDIYEMNGMSKEVTSSNLMTYCKITEIKPGQLKFEGDGFSLGMSYNPKVVTPEIEYIKVTDNVLKRYWPNGVTRIKLAFINPGLKGGQTIKFTSLK
jgi:hypothetical protein